MANLDFTLEELNTMQRSLARLFESLMNITWDETTKLQIEYIDQLVKDSSEMSEIMRKMRNKLADHLGYEWDSEKEKYV